MTFRRDVLCLLLHKFRALPTYTYFTPNGHMKLTNLIIYVSLMADGEGRHFFSIHKNADPLRNIWQEICNIFAEICS